jgi:hypothetical protein
VVLHGPLFSARNPLDRDNAASRISAYIYGNILVLTALVPIVTAEKHLGILVVLGAALSTFIAHSFAETVARTSSYVSAGSSSSSADSAAGGPPAPPWSPRYCSLSPPPSS